MLPVILVAIGVWFIFVGFVGVKRGFFLGLVGRTQLIPWLTGEEKRPLPNYKTNGVIKKRYKKADKIYNSVFILVGAVLAIAGLILLILGIRL